MARRRKPRIESSVVKCGVKKKGKMKCMREGNKHRKGEGQKVKIKRKEV